MPKPYKRGETFWGRIMHQGREYRRSLETTSRAVAEERLQAWIKELKGTNWGEKPRRTFDEAVRRYLTDHVERLKPRVKTGYIRALLKMTPTFEGKRLDQISTGLISEYEARRRKDKVADGTIRRDLTVLSGLFSHAMLWEWHTSNPAQTYLARRAQQGLKDGEPETRYLSHEEEQAFTNYIAHKRATVKGNRDKHAWIMFEAAFCLAVDAGLRQEEQLSLEWTDVDLDNREITVRKEVSKTKRRRVVPILPRSLELLRALPRHASAPYVFWHTARGEVGRYTQCYRTLVRHADKLRIADVCWHDLRRTCGCRLLQDYRLPMERVSAWLGHQNLQTTEKTYAFLDVRHLHQSLAEHEQRRMELAQIPAQGFFKTGTLIEKT